MSKFGLLVAAVLAGMAAGNSPVEAANSTSNNTAKKSSRPSKPTAKPAKTQPAKTQPAKTHSTNGQKSKGQAQKSQTPKPQAFKTQTPKAQPSSTKSATPPAPSAQPPSAQSPSPIKVQVTEPAPSSAPTSSGGPPDAVQGMGQTRWQGQVVEVSDGDSMIVMFEDTPRRISLSGVDAPERGQPFAAEATGFLKSLVLGKTVQVQLQGRGLDGESLAQVTVGTNDVGAWMVSEGYAWWHREYAPHDTALQEKEAAAKTAARGLWSEADAIAPWEYRKR